PCGKRTGREHVARNGDGAIDLRFAARGDPADQVIVVRRAHVDPPAGGDAVAPDRNRPVGVSANHAAEVMPGSLGNLAVMSRAFGIAALAFVLVLAAAGCGSGGDSSGAASTTTSTLLVTYGPQPTASARMICAAEGQSEIASSLGVKP